MLDYKYDDPDEFKQAFDTLNKKAQQKVIDEMKRRGWH